MLSWIALRRADQIAHSVTIILVNSTWDKVSCKKKSQFLAFGSVNPIMWSMRFESKRSQVHRDILQSIKECRHESMHPHRALLLDFAIFRCCNRSAEGIDWFARSQTKIFSFDGTDDFHRFVQAFSVLALLEDSGTPSSQFSRLVLVWTSILQADLTEKSPLWSKCQVQKSAIPPVHKGILTIASASIGRKTWRTKSVFHEASAWMINSWTISGGFCMCGSKSQRRGSLGIQFQSHTQVVWPSPMRRIRPCFKTSLPSNIPRHTWDGLAPSCASRIVELGK